MMVSSLNSERKRARIGASPLQSMHQCAQKNSSSGDPFSWVSEAGRDPRYSPDFNVGAACPTKVSRFKFLRIDSQKFEPADLRGTGGSHIEVGRIPGIAPSFANPAEGIAAAAVLLGALVHRLQGRGSDPGALAFRVQRTDHHRAHATLWICGPRRRRNSPGRACLHQPRLAAVLFGVAGYSRPG